MGAITRAAANNITTGGVILPAGINDASVASITALAQVSSGDGITLISSQTASSSASISFTGIDSTYKTYMFKFINIHPSNDGDIFTFQAGSGYNTTITSTFFQALHNESDSYSVLEYSTTRDLAQQTTYQALSDGIGFDNDQSCSGYLYVFNPSSTTYVKNFIGCCNNSSDTNYSRNEYSAGYFDTTSALTQFQFKFTSGNIDAGTIHMYGIA